MSSPPTLTRIATRTDEPVPTKAWLHRDYQDPENLVTIHRTWTAQGAMDCHRCDLCPFEGHTLESLEGKRIACELTVNNADLDKVLYGATPEPETSEDEPGIVANTEWTTGEVSRHKDIVVATPKAWAKHWRSKDPTWGTSEIAGGKLLMAVRTRQGPLPWILEPSKSESEALA